jgi:hypothetical protein
MKKSIAYIGAFFMSALAFAQVSKNDNVNKTASRKVLNDDLKNVSPDTDAEVKSGQEKMSYHQKTSSKQSEYIKISDQSDGDNKTSVIQKGKEKSISPIEETITQKGNGKAFSTTEKQHYTIKMSNSNKMINDTIQKTSSSSNNFMKITDIKGEK